MLDLILLAVVSSALEIAAGGGAFVVGFAVAIAYFGCCEGSRAGQTIGKRALGIRVVDSRSGGPIGFGRAVLRYAASFASALPCFLGYLWMLWDGERQTWHDKLAADVVVPVSSRRAGHRS